MNWEVIDDVPTVVAADESPVDYPTCNVPGCDEPLAPYGGMGPRPKKCVEHKKGGGRSKSTSVARTGSTSRKAKQAAGILVQWNSMAALGLFMTGYQETHSAMSMAQEGFHASAETALEGNPELCDTIIRIGAKSSSASLVIVYGQMLMAVAPVLLMEHRAKLAEKRERMEGVE